MQQSEEQPSAPFLKEIESALRAHELVCTIHVKTHPSHFALSLSYGIERLVWSLLTLVLHTHSGITSGQCPCPLCEEKEGGQESWHCNGPSNQGGACTGHWAHLPSLPPWDTTKNWLGKAHDTQWKRPREKQEIENRAGLKVRKITYKWMFFGCVERNTINLHISLGM